MTPHLSSLLALLSGRSPPSPFCPPWLFIVHVALNSRNLPIPTPTDSKLDSKSSLHLLNELADLHSCSNALYFEARRHEDLYMWASRTPNGPSVKCHVQNIHTMDELKMTGNCLKGSRGICVFDGEWEQNEEYKLLKEMFSHVSCDGKEKPWGGVKWQACGEREEPGVGDMSQLLWIVGFAAVATATAS